MRLLVAGGGYVGLASATGFARQGHNVQVVEIDKKRAELLEAGITPFLEPSVSDAYEKEIQSGHITIRSSYKALTGPVDYAFICTSSPLTPEGLLDTSQIFQAAEMLAGSSACPTRLVVRSTVNPGTTEAVERSVRAQTRGISVLMNPEFLREGSALRDFEQPSRIVIGGSDLEAVDGLSALYSFTGAPVIRTNTRTAELTKLAANAALAVRVSMVNELAQVARSADADLDVLLDGVGADPRIGREYLSPGLGFGGSCLPKDLAAFRSSAHQTGMATPVFDGASETNDYVVESLAEKAGGLVLGRSGNRICVIGIGFKPGSDSLRNSQPVRLVRSLLQREFDVTIYDPIALHNARQEFSNESRVTYADSVEQAVNECDAVIVIDRGLMNGNMAITQEKAIIDSLGRQIFPSTPLSEGVNGNI